MRAIDHPDMQALVRAAVRDPMIVGIMLHDLRHMRPNELYRPLGARGPTYGYSLEELQLALAHLRMIGHGPF